MVKGVQVYGESHDDTHAMKISYTLFVVPLRRSDAHIWSSANEPEFGKVANAKFIAHYAGHEVRSDLSAKDSIIAVLALYARPKSFVPAMRFLRITAQITRA